MCSTPQYPNTSGALQTQPQQLISPSQTAAEQVAPQPPLYPFLQFYHSLQPQLEAQNYPAEHIPSCIKQNWDGLSLPQKNQWYESFEQQMLEYNRLCNVTRNTTSEPPLTTPSELIEETPRPTGKTRTRPPRKRANGKERVLSPVSRYRQNTLAIREQPLQSEDEMMIDTTEDSTHPCYSTSATSLDVHFAKGEQLKIQLGCANTKHRATTSEEAYMKASLLAAVGSTKSS